MSDKLKDKLDKLEFLKEELMKRNPQYKQFEDDLKLKLSHITDPQERNRAEMVLRCKRIEELTEKLNKTFEELKQKMGYKS